MKETLAKKLRRWRVTNGLSTRELSYQLGVPESTYREWENGRQIRGEPYVRLAEALGVPLSSLFHDDCGLERERLRSELKDLQDRLEQIQSKIMSLI